VRFHQVNIEYTLAELKSTPQGITGDEARKRLAQYGPNVLVERKKKTVLVMFLGQFTDFMILVLIAAAVISGIIGEVSDTIAIVVIVLLNAVLGFSQEYRAEKAIAALKKMAASNAVVLRILGEMWRYWWRLRTGATGPALAAGLPRSPCWPLSWPFSSGRSTWWRSAGAKAPPPKWAATRNTSPTRRASHPRSPQEPPCRRGRKGRSPGSPPASFSGRARRRTRRRAPIPAPG
jgi:hypothetical protein